MWCLSTSLATPKLESKCLGLFLGYPIVHHMITPCEFPWIPSEMHPASIKILIKSLMKSQLTTHSSDFSKNPELHSKPPKAARRSLMTTPTCEFRELWSCQTWPWWPSGKHTKKIWKSSLVGGIATLLKNMSSSIGMMTVAIDGQVTKMFQTTKGIYFCKRPSQSKDIVKWYLFILHVPQTWPKKTTV